MDADDQGQLRSPDRGWFGASAALLLRHVSRLPQQVPLTGQPGRTTGLERLGFYGDTWAALRAGLRAALRAGLRAALRVGPPGRAARRAAGRAARRTDNSAAGHTWLGTQAGAGGATWANRGWKAETTAGRTRTGRAPAEMWVSWESDVITVISYNPLGDYY